MIALHGQLSDGRSAALRDASLLLGEHGRVELHLDGARHVYLLGQLRISDRLGHLPRRVQLPAGEQFETADNDALDGWLKTQQHSTDQHWVHRLEQRWHWALAALLLSVSLVAGGIWWGIPAAAERIALSLPPEANAAIGVGTLEVLDRAFVGPSELAEADRQRLEQGFAGLAADFPDLDLRLQFRAGDQLGANAFALPDGTLIVTDELVELAAEDAEVLAVLAHEIGHVTRRHGLRGVLQGAGVATLVAGLLGDLASVTALAASLPTALVHASYSRDFEREADAFALVLMDRHQLPRKHFANMLQKLSQAAGESSAFFASHPNTAERVQLIAE